MADPGPTGPRRPWLDALRGLAICGMVAYHAAWDLSALGWPVPPPAGAPGWSLLGETVAATFLVLSGIGLVLARPRGAGFAARRLALLAGAGVAVSAASLLVAPDAPIVFGILQCLAASNALALAVLAWPAPARLALAAACAALPALARNLGGVSALESWPAAALGLGAHAPATLDYRPLLPWAALVLFGTLIGDRIARQPQQSPAVPGRLGAVLPRLGAGLSRLGRHSLAIYLLHQPLLYGVLLAATPLVAPAEAGRDPFAAQCRSDCAATGASPRLCSAACACTSAQVAAQARGGASRLTAPGLAAIGRACRAAPG